jgi:predicted transglutaminase-like cysteine proteinase
MEAARQTTRRLFRLTGSLGIAGLLSGLMATPSHAHLPSAAYSAVLGCSGQASLANPQETGPFVTDKASAILGGQPSALDLISAQQAGASTDSVAAYGAPVLPAVSAQSLPCSLGQQFITTTPDSLTALPAARGDFLGSTLITIGSTPFDREWKRVSRQSSALSISGSVFGEPHSAEFDKVKAVNAWVNRHVAFVEDRRLYGKSDYWATADETLRRMRGDCEDFAILKYQLLLNAGIPSDAMYLTLVWDTVRRRDHAVLIVKSGEDYHLLDNNVDEVLPADGSLDYSARLSFSARAFWIHGQTERPDTRGNLPTQRFAYFSDKAVSNARLTGLSK